MDEIPVPVPMADPPPEKHLSALRKVPRRALTISLATTALVVAGGAVLAGAVTAPGGGNSTTAPAPGQPASKGDRMHMAGPMQAVHGEYVVRDGNGNYRTEEMQRGSVTAVNGDTFTVKSEDGFTATYTVTSTTKVRKAAKAAAIGDVATGDKIVVIATKNGSTLTATRLADHPTK